MCAKCDGKITAKPWKFWAGIVVTLALFFASQIFMYGQVVGTVQEHIKNDPTYKELTEEFVNKDEFKTIKEMIMYLYQKEGGK